ncbi:lipid kinase [Minwuia sp.]|uniref:lipid kinase n=1 Tax=Minwuia sp. TaxID=2493630 RepID=UPI003A92FA9B
MDVSGNRALLIINRRSGDGLRPTELATAALEKAGFEVDAHSPEDPAKIPELIQEHAGQSARIVLGGGDGTFSRAASSLIASDRPVGFLPMGTANDLARTLGIPADIVAAAKIAAGDRRRLIDLGTINDRPFFNVASMGFSARVAQYHEGERKSRFKLLSYPISWLDAQRDMEPFEVTMRYGKRKRKFRSTMVAVGNGVHYGGGLRIADDAAIDDGWLDVFYVKPLGPWGMLKLLPFLKFGALKRRQDVRTVRAKALTIEIDPVQDINVDGEIVEKTPARFGMLRQALEVFVPVPR